MPWLVKEEESKEEKLLFIHVPRCGGTSLIKLYNVEAKCRRVSNLYHKIGQLYFFYRYRLLEQSNFPIKSFENLYALTVFITATIVYFAVPDWGIAACSWDRWCPPPISISFWVCGFATFFMSTFVMAANVMGRRDIVRRLCMWAFGKIMFGFGGAPQYLHGVNYDGYLMHYTAEKLISHKFIKPADLQDSFAIVRNPFSRMVSVYRYNQAHSCESFAHFVKEWRKKFTVFEMTGSTEEWDVYCHVLPMHSFTHFRGQQLVPYIIRQEDLKIIKRRDGQETDLYQSRYADLPEKVIYALTNMPHTNKRASKGPAWYDLYDQETMDVVLEMFAQDFVTYGYETTMPKRDDLKPKYTLAQLTAKLHPANVNKPAKKNTASAATMKRNKTVPEDFDPERIIVNFDDDDDHCDTGSSVSSLSASSASSSSRPVEDDEEDDDAHDRISSEDSAQLEAHIRPASEEIYVNVRPADASSASASALPPVASAPATTGRRGRVQNESPQPASTSGIKVASSFRDNSDPDVITHV
mmetsp:Transcript_10651/g.20954  ORF Transcript_10651/g.20954 Transcript_10651/m.20954 type:complete len:525 (+) Transcript_10651:822-2396(+)|eukprot:CAMPEP_0171498430 /NCGR_PEP_ID=MMETSP0958-20121227/7847_1 /TAXON_ID=87120 /ORGANISM="Aurantiochytrium limacinum, Strain ATCCMYA-1381" /LENGTH=524 /DNA_ID=CAMNT_0012032831 /DNA_START=828 /DNA_END=2402 /DNA_ORIENTATION=-